MILAKWSTKTRILVGALVAAIVLLAGSGLFFMLRNDADENSVSTALTLADEKTMAGDYDQALAALKQAESQAKDTEQKIQLLNSLAAAAANAGQLSEALDYYNQKHQLDPASIDSDGYLVGELYERLSDTQKAVEQFELYLDYLKANPPEENGQASIESMEIRIQQLKEGQQ
jgi:tetratricopeptide (TPR) repeat protein